MRAELGRPACYQGERDGRGWLPAPPQRGSQHVLVWVKSCDINHTFSFHATQVLNNQGWGEKRGWVGDDRETGWQSHWRGNERQDVGYINKTWCNETWWPWTCTHTQLLSLRILYLIGGVIWTIRLSSSILVTDSVGEQDWQFNNQLNERSMNSIAFTATGSKVVK